VQEGIVGECVTSQKILNIPDAYHHPLFNPKIDRRTGYRTLSILCFPIFDGKQQNPIGAIQLINRFATPKRSAEADVKEGADGWRTISKKDCSKKLRSLNQCLDFFGDKTLQNKHIDLLVENI
jgi:hypothetical protein